MVFVIAWDMGRNMSPAGAEKQSQPFTISSRGEVWGRQSAGGGLSSQIQCESRGKYRQQDLNGTAELLHFTFSTFLFSSCRSDERLKKWRSWNIQSQGWFVQIIHYHLPSPLGFLAIWIHEDCGFSLFYIILFNVAQKLSHLLLHTLKPQLEETQLSIEDLEKKKSSKIDMFH